MAASVEEFRNFPFLDNDNIIANLAQELPDYLAAADGVVMANEEEKLAWWAAHSGTLLHWPDVVKTLLVTQPSSASAERVFSLLKNVFNDQQDNALEDSLEASSLQPLCIIVSYHDKIRYKGYKCDHHLHLFISYVEHHWANVGYIEHQSFNQSNGPNPELYRRHIDDCVGATSSSREELNQFYNCC